MRNLSAKYLLLILTIIFFLQCGKKIDTSQLTNLNNNTITVLGHRGSGVSVDNTYPMNTLESIEVGIEEMGADGMEIDAQLTKDNQLMLYHDDELAIITSFSGLINSYTRTELSNCVINSAFFNNEFKQYHLASLEEVFERYKSYYPSPVCYIDIKPYYDTVNFQSYSDYANVFAQTMNALISKYNRQESTLLSCTDTIVLRSLQKVSPSLKLFIDDSDFDVAFQRATSMGLFGITINYEKISKADVEKTHANNLRIIVYSVKSRAACREIDRFFPDYVETDNVLYMLSLTK
jgi:glycerophosphoryl diester phosphodiesterase